MAANDWAVVIGINEYPQAGVNPLEGAVRDATLFHQWLVSPEGGNVPFRPDAMNVLTNANHVQLLVSDHPNQPTFVDVLKFFLDLLDRVVANPGGRLYVYCSGHGISPSGQDSIRNAALLMANARAPRFWHNFPGNLWAEAIRSAALFREVVLVMDCCRDLMTNATAPGHVFGEPVEDSKRGVLIEMYATSWASKARELPFPPASQKRGVFTYSLLEVLKSGQVTAACLKQSVEAHLARELKSRGESRPQQPEIKVNPEAAMKTLVFNEKGQPPQTPVTITNVQNPLVRQVDPATGKLIAVPGWQGLVGKLVPGIYQVTDQTTKAAQNFEVLAGVPAIVEL